MARIALVNVPFVSHVASMLRLAAALSRQGHELIVWAPGEWRSEVEKVGAYLEPSAPQMPRPPAGRIAAEFAALTEREAERLIPQLHAHDVDLVIRDSQTPWALVAAQYLGIPQIVSLPMFPMLGVEPPETAPPDSRDRERFEQSWLSISRRWGVELADVRGLYHSAPEPTLVFTTSEIVGDQELPSGWRCIGPLLSPPSARRSGSSRPLVYASFGTAQNRRTELFRLVIEALAGQPVEVLISAGGRRLGPSALGPVPSNVTVTEFASTRDALAGAAVHISHCGCNSVHESLIAGVPIVCLPQAFDQIPLSRRLEQLGVGVVADQDPDSVADAVLTLLNDVTTARRAASLAEHLQTYDGESRLAAAIAEWS